MPYCILCKSYFLKFTTYNKRPDVGCPNCHSAERHRLFGYYYDKYVPNKQNLNVLHIAPENCLYNLLRKSSGSYVCGDLNPSTYTNMNCIKMDATHLENDAESIDLILASHIMEHIPDDRKALSEFNRVLKKGGKLIIMIPQNFQSVTTDEDPTVISHADRTKRFGQFDHVRMYGLDVVQRIQQAGFFVRAYIPTVRTNEAAKMKPNSTVIIADETAMKDNKFSPHDILYECIKN
jgi:SAM-dependent methyltransferase